MLSPFAIHALPGCLSAVPCTRPRRMLPAGLLDLLDELTSGSLIMPRALQLNPTEEAVAWADSEAGSVPVEAWPGLGVPGASTETSLVCSDLHTPAIPHGYESPLDYDAK